MILATYPVVGLIDTCLILLQSYPYLFFILFLRTMFVFKGCVHYIFASLVFKVSEYPFKENKSTFKNTQVLLCTHFYNISLYVLRPNFLDICSLTISHSADIRRIRVKAGPKTNYFSYFMSTCTYSIVVFNNFFSLIFNQTRNKQNRARDFVLFK